MQSAAGGALRVSLLYNHFSSDLLDVGNEVVKYYV